LLEILKQQLSQSRVASKLNAGGQSGPEDPHNQSGFVAPHSRTTSTVDSLTHTKVSTLIWTKIITKEEAAIGSDAQWTSLTLWRILTPSIKYINKSPIQVSLLSARHLGYQLFFRGQKRTKL